MADSFRTKVGNVRLRDGMQNFEARIGLGTDNQMSSTTYGFSGLTRNRAILDNMYRSTWIVRQAVGVVAEDMTRAGVELKGGDSPEDLARVQSRLRNLNVWGKVTEGIKWGRLYGGALGVVMVDGQSLGDPLRVETVGKGQFRGVVVLDRWMVTPSAEVVQELGPDFGLPVYYTINVGDREVPKSLDRRIHYSRVVRFLGDDLPHFQSQYEQGWGMSIVEPFYDRLIAFDSATMGAAQMVYKAHLRVLKMKDLRSNIAQGGKPYEASIAQVNMIRRYQSMEGLTLIDAQDEFRSDTYSFTGLDSVLIQFAQQVAGATKIPVVKLFGMSPAGFSTGETDLRSYYDNVNLEQERKLRHPLDKILRVAYQSELGSVPEDFWFEFLPLWGLSTQEKSTIASTVASSVTNLQMGQILTRSQALQELKALSLITGVFTSITDEDIDAARREEQAAAQGQGDGGNYPSLPGEAGGGETPADVGETPPDPTTQGQPGDQLALKLRPLRLASTG